jgi:hypothetical protein
MTAFLDVAFTNAAAEDFVILPASGEWTGLENALTQPTDGAASFPMAAGSFTSGLVLTGNDIIPPGNASVTGLQVRLWVSSTTQAGLRAQYWLKDLTLGGLKVTVPGGGGVLAGPANWPNATPPSEAQELGATDSIEPFKALSLTQAKSNTRLDLQFVNPTAAARTVYVWNAQLRLWLDLPSMQDVVQRAYRKLSILSKDTTIEGDDLAYGLQSLNDMLFGWETYGVNIGHQERVADEAFPIARKYV